MLTYETRSWITNRNSAELLTIEEVSGVPREALLSCFTVHQSLTSEQERALEDLCAKLAADRLPSKRRRVARI